MCVGGGGIVYDDASGTDPCQLTKMGLFSYSPMLTRVYYLAYLYNLSTLCLNGTLSCVNFMDVTMGDIPVIPPW